MPAAQRVGCGVPFDEIEGAVAVGVAQLVGDADRAAAAAAEVLFKEALVAFQLGIALDGAVGADGRGALARTVRTEIAVGGDGAAAHVDGDGVEVELGAEEQLLDLAVDDEDGRGVIGDLPLGKGKALPVEGTDLEGDGAVRLGAERQRRHGRGRRRGRILGVVFADVGEGARFPPVDKDGEVAVADGVCGFGEGDLNIACRYGDARAFAVDGNADIAVGCGGEHDLVGRFALFAHAHLLAFDGDGKAVIPRSGEREPEGEILRPVAAADARRAVERVPFERHVLAQRDAVALADGIGEIVAVVVQSGIADRGKDAVALYRFFCVRNTERDAHCRHAEQKRRQQRDQTDLLLTHLCEYDLLSQLCPHAPLPGAPRGQPFRRTPQRRAQNARGSRSGLRVKLVPVYFTLYACFCQTHFFAFGKFLCISAICPKILPYRHNSNGLSRSKYFQGALSAGGCTIKRMRSLVTGWVNESEYAHSASQPFLAFSPP